MKDLDGYALERCLGASVRSEIHRARDASEGRAVLIKAYNRLGTAEADSTARREYELLRSLPPGIAPRPLALEENEEVCALVLEQLEGSAPEHPPLELLLQVAVGAAGALAQLHAARIVHRNLRPQNLFVEEGSGRILLTGFSHAAPLGAPADRGGAPSVINLHYAAPEQSGRLERGVDFRSDLYALGASLYERLIGTPPFDAHDPRDLIHAHVAVRPPPPVDLNPEIPSTLSRIVMKLLEKAPEDRYQTAEALQVDLETCLEQLRRTGSIDDELPLGTADAPYRPLFRQRIYGRQNECEALWRAYRAASEGELTLVLVSGAPGIGKSALVPELHRPLALDGGHLVRGKFDLYRGHLPYAALISALRALAHQVSSESETQRARWRERLSAELGRLAPVATDWVPELHTLLGTQPAPAPLGPRETQQRLALAVRRLLLGAARVAEPLVLFLDDLQWADAGSRFLIEELLSCRERAPLLLVGAYRDHDVSASHPLQQLIHRLELRGGGVESIALAPLSDPALREMLADALGVAPSRVRELAAHVAERSGNNPLLVQQCVFHLHDLGAIAYQKGTGWTWDLSAARCAAVPTDPAGMMKAKLQRLRGEARAALELASCVGDEFDVDRLAELSQRPRALLEAVLYELSDAGLIAPCPEGFRFVHDRIREAAQALLPDRPRAQLHLRTAKLLIEGLSSEEKSARVFEIADHLVRARDEIPASLRQEALACHHRGGIAALTAGASATADHYLRAALELFRDEDWSGDGARGFELHLLASEAALQLQEFERALQHLAPLEQRSWPPHLAVRVSAQRIKVASLSRPVAETVDLTLAELHRFGLRLPSQPTWIRVRWEILRTDWALRHAGRRGSLRYAPSESEPPWWMVWRVGARSVGPLCQRLACVAQARIVRGILGAGEAESAAAALSGYALYRRALLQDARDRSGCIDLIRSYVARSPDTPLELWAEMDMQAFFTAWRAPRRHVTHALVRLAERLHEHGYWEIANSASLVRAYYLGLSGAALPEVVRAFDAVPERSHRTPFDDPRVLATPYRLLAEGADLKEPFDALRDAFERHAGGAQIAATHWMLALCTTGRFEEAWWLSELVRPILFSRFAMVCHTADHIFLRGLAACALARSDPGPGARRLRRAARRCRAHLRRDARDGPDFAHMELLLHAEIEATRGRAAQALPLYRRAAERARTAEYGHHVALAHERCGARLRALGRQADAYKSDRRAAELYDAWGAPAVARALQSRVAGARRTPPPH